MEIKVKYHKGVLKPLHKIKGIKEGEVLNIVLEGYKWNKLAMNNPSFSFLKHEPDTYTKSDVVKE